MNKVLITGSDGFVARNLINFYQHKYTILKYSKKDNLDLILSNNPDVIINCAASIYDVESMFNTNVVLVNHLIDYAKQTKKKLIQIGSSAEYGKKDYPTKETDTINPLSFYAGTKAAATMICQSAAIEFDIPIVIARPYSLYGIYEKSYRLFTKLLAAFTNNEGMTLFDGYHDFIYIKDFVRGIDKLVTSEYDKGDIINFGSGIQTSNKQILELFIEIFGFLPETIKFNDSMAKSFESKTWICDTSYAKYKYGFATEYSLKDGILDLIKTKGINI